MKLLLVGQMVGQRHALYECLAKNGHRVECAADGRSATSRLGADDFDQIILDLTQPDESSLLFLHEIREQNHKGRILVLSTPEQISSRVTALIQGADDFLVKPFTAAQLCERIGLLAGKRAPEAQNVIGYDKVSYLNQMLENLLKLCRQETSGIELVISEARLSDLLADAMACLQAPAAQKKIVIHTPSHKLPTVLVDTRWTEHLLVNLLNHVIEYSLSNAQVSLQFHAANQVGDLVIETAAARPPQGGAIESSAAELPAAEQSADSLTLARYCADCLQLGLQRRLTHDNRLQIRLSNIRIV